MDTTLSGAQIMTIDWSSPEARYNLIEQVGPAEYSRLHANQMEKAVCKIVNGHKIRRMQTRFGMVYQVGDTGMAFHKLEMAEGHAWTTEAREQSGKLKEVDKNSS